jgi:N6-adenosine-specific RNA methylase IME4
MSEWEEGCEDERLWTWHSEDMGDSLAYQTMSVEEIRALRLPLAETAHVWLWTTQRFLLAAFTCLEAWGLTYSCTFV